MSWMWGVYKASKENWRERDPGIDPNGKLFDFENNRVYIEAGGNPDTTFCSSNNTENSGFAVNGVGLLYEADTYKWMQEGDWKWQLDQANPFDSVYGHYVMVKWSGKHLRIKTDRLGLRTLFITRDDKQNIIFSTRLDWLADLSCSSMEIDFDVYSGRWLLIDQISRDCCVTGVQKIGPNSTVEISSVGTDLEREVPDNYINPFNRNRASYGSFKDELRRAALPEIPGEYQTSLGLSGGLDSRLLLSVMEESIGDDFHVHMCEASPHPDVTTAIDISQVLGLNYQHFEQRLPTFNQDYEQIMDFVGQVGTTLPLYETKKWNYAKRLDSNQFFHVDGAYGEFMRHSFLYRINQFSINDAYSLSAEKLLGGLRSPGPKIFKYELWRRMDAMVKNQVKEMWRKSADVAEGRLLSSIELFILNTRPPNTSSHSQPWLDKIIPNIMPFIESKMLEREFNMRSEKGSDRYFKNIIKQTNRELTRFSLVKNEIQYPFGLNELGGRIYRKLKRKIGIAETRNRAKRFLKKNEEFVRDTVRSRGVREYDAYDYDKINGLVQNFYDGDDDKADALNQWLSFECWRQSLQAGD